MAKQIQGVIRGKTIILEAEAGLGDGQRVEVTVRPVIDDEGRRRRLAALAGSLAGLADRDWSELDEIIAGRQRWPHRELPE